jgi:hypothetical protein
LSCKFPSRGGACSALAPVGQGFPSTRRPLEEIEADIRAIEKDIMRMLAEVTGNAPGSDDGDPV